MSMVCTGRFQIIEPSALRASVPGSLADTAIVPNSAVACGTPSVRLVRTSTLRTGPLLKLNPPLTYTNSEMRSNTRSADAPMTGPAKAIEIGVPPVGIWKPDKPKLATKSTVGVTVGASAQALPLLTRTSMLSAPKSSPGIPRIAMLSAVTLSA